jgi:glycosyltransferase involved in cell wall biosynthesis
MKLALFMTRGLSLAHWESKGLLSRELMIYERMKSSGVISTLYIFTYGAVENEKAILRTLGYDWIFIFGASHASKGLVSWWKSFAFLYSFRKELSSMDIFKSNQFDGSWSALLASYVFNGKSLVRSGYSAVLFEHNYVKRLIYQGLEFIVYKLAHLVFVSTEWERQKISRLNSNVHVLPNFVESQETVKDLQLRNTESLLYVGRINDVQKNFTELVKAAAKSGYGLHLLGGYSDEEKMMISSVCQCFSCDFKMLGKVENTDISKYYQDYAYYILPSNYEGMPKTLIEAMMNGCIVIGTPVVGIKELVNNGITGLLSDSTNSKDLIKVLSRLYCNTEMSKSANKYARDNFSLESVVKKHINFMVNMK